MRLRGLSLSVAVIAVGAAVSRADDFPVNPKRTYLRVNSDTGHLPAVPISLQDLSFPVVAGDTLRITRLGNFFDGNTSGDTVTGMVGVFSSNNTLLGGANLNRVPGAIDAGVDFTTQLTYYGGLTTDITQDFRISGGPASGITFVDVQVPSGANYLFVTPNDSLFGDNTDPNGNFRVRLTPIPEPGSVLLACAAAGLGWQGFRRLRTRAKSAPTQG